MTAANTKLQEQPYDSKKSSYAQILKVSAAVGGSSAVAIFLGIIRTKALALILGPVGIGLIGVFTGLLEIAKSIAIMGVNNSGVREIAEAAATGNSLRIAETVETLRKIVLALGVGAALLLLAVSRPISLLTFGDTYHTKQIALLSVAVFLSAISAGQSAFIQGMRRITDLAKMNILGAFFGTLASIVLIYVFREKGIVMFLVVIAATASLTSWWYSCKIQVDKVDLAWHNVFKQARSLLKLGFVFMATGLMTFGVAFMVKVLVLRKLGADAAGFYQASWVLAGLYVGFILQAMGADFYPRLTGVASNKEDCNKAVNEQTEIALLLAGPGVLATLTFAPVVINVFYSAQFHPAVELLRWCSLGMLLRVASWPMGFIMLARNESRLFFLTELAANLVHIILATIFITTFGLNGVGIAFASLYCFHWLVLYFVAYRITDFRFSSENKKIALVIAPSTFAVFVVTQFASSSLSFIFGLVLTLSVTYLSTKTLCHQVSTARLPNILRNVLHFFRLIPTPQKS